MMSLRHTIRTFYSAAFHPLQRPIIHEKHDKRESYDHGLGHEPKSEKQNYKEVPPPAWRVSVFHISQKRRKAKHRAKKILPLRYPGDRFDVKRVDGEEEGDKSAP